MIDLKDYIKTLKKNIILISLIFVVSLAAGYLYTKTIPIKYQSSINIYTTDPSDLVAFLSTNNSINLAYKDSKNILGNFNSTELSIFRSNIRVQDISLNIVSLQITDTNKQQSINWINAFKKVILKSSTKIFINKLLKKEYLACKKAQLQALKIDKSNNKVQIPTCTILKFVQYINPNTTTISIIPSKTTNLIIFGIAGILIALLYASYKEYK